MKYAFTALLTAVVALMFLAAPATADWNVGDGHKMHFPQLPDPNGWDVPFGSAYFYDDPNGTSYERYTWALADDWQCSQDGEVTDIHFWVSRQMFGNGVPGGPGVVPFKVTRVNVAIYGNIAQNEYGFSQPDYDGLNTWNRDFVGDQIQVRWAGQGDQGWYDTATEEESFPDHVNYYQVNITGIPEPFFQTAGEIYWLGLLDVGVEDIDGNPVTLGWKTTAEHFMDDAVYQADVWGSDGYESHIPEELWIRDVSRDLAFVITPEPGTVAMLLSAGAIGIVALLRRRRSRTA